MSFAFPIWAMPERLHLPRLLKLLREADFVDRAPAWRHLARSLSALGRRRSDKAGALSWMKAAISMAYVSLLHRPLAALLLSIPLVACTTDVLAPPARIDGGARVGAISPAPVAMPEQKVAAYPAEGPVAIASQTSVTPGGQQRSSARRCEHGRHAWRRTCRWAGAGAVA